MYYVKAANAARIHCIASCLRVQNERVGGSACLPQILCPLVVDSDKVKDKGEWQNNLYRHQWFTARLSRGRSFPTLGCVHVRK